MALYHNVRSVRICLVSVKPNHAVILQALFHKNNLEESQFKLKDGEGCKDEKILPLKLPKVGKGPEVPFSQLHGKDNFFTNSEVNSYVRYMVPGVSEINPEKLRAWKEEKKVMLNKIRERIVKKYLEVDLVLISSQASLLSKEMIGRVEKVRAEIRESLLEMAKEGKQKDVMKAASGAVGEACSQLNRVLDSIPTKEVQARWELVKKRLPAWQEKIANSLQNAQDYLDKKINPKKGP